MAGHREQQRRHKRILVASIGVATVSFMSLQTGCQEEEPVSSGNLLPLPPSSVGDPAVAGDAAVDATMDAMLTTGNLLPPPGVVHPSDAALDAFVSGNLIAPPPADAAEDAAADAAADAATDGAARDAAPADAKIVLPPSGNLMPVPPDGTR